MTELRRATSLPELFEKRGKLKTAEGVAHGLAYKPDPTDIFIATPPKCGTTWMQQIVHGLRTRGSMDFDEITRVVPWIELAKDMGIDIYAPQVAKPRAFKTHLNLDIVPKGGKYITVIRDPKDALLSCYRFFEGLYFEKGAIPIQDFAREFYIKELGREYWKHVLAIWYHRNDKNVLPLCYENLKQDLPGTVKRVADFIGIELDDELREIVVRQADFKFMDEHSHKFNDHILRQARNAACGIPAGSLALKVRSGNVGESKIHVPKEIVDEFDVIWQEEITAKTGLKSYDDLREEIDQYNLSNK